MMPFVGETARHAHGLCVDGVTRTCFRTTFLGASHCMHGDGAVGRWVAGDKRIVDVQEELGMCAQVVLMTAIATAFHKLVVLRDAHVVFHVLAAGDVVHHRRHILRARPPTVLEQHLCSQLPWVAQMHLEYIITSDRDIPIMKDCLRGATHWAFERDIFTHDHATLTGLAVKGTSALEGAEPRDGLRLHQVHEVFADAQTVKGMLATSGDHLIIAFNCF